MPDLCIIQNTLVTICSSVVSVFKLIKVFGAGLIERERDGEREREREMEREIAKRQNQREG